jgi:hypothetical protein
MEIQPNVVANREASINKQNVNQDILQKTLEKSAKTAQRQQAGEPRAVNQVRGEKQGEIDLYA